MSKDILITGGRPTGNLHLGHFLGAFKKTVDIHKNYNSFFIISNFHMLTTKKRLKDLEEMPKNILDMVAECIAMGMDPDSINFYLQSNIIEMPKLYTFIQNHININSLIDNDSINEMKNHSQSFSLGLLAYSVMEAADIIGIGADVVPVGVDNIDHLNITHQIIDSINKEYSSSLKKPEVVQSVQANIIGLDLKNKMSKSLDNCIYLKDDSDIIYQKLNNIEPKNRYDLLMNFKEALGQHYDTKFIANYSDLIDLVIEIVDPISLKRKELLSDPSYLIKLIDEGTQKANEQFSFTVNSIFEPIKFTSKSIFEGIDKFE
ncbi:tryptophanyl-tRNA synthetase [Melghiribacillus thermohalophilus]|uniref:Tryptophan--tRNA ligase n=1 Tax=Melghiribacillus thermohalophilus TaxID=1324956 RepID=A0A4R3MVD4_9BACI|nr:tryptophan--tRNA ligase [Melghiribacillus thermohalophilus]TCT17494.1 tryptophanyl-tRNA synthetase [Melghiribacillus thermohalophilus]